MEIGKETGEGQMLGQKPKAFREQIFSLEQLVPQEHFYRKLEAKLDLRFVYDLVKDCYASSMGRPSIDPVVFFKYITQNPSWVF